MRAIASTAALALALAACDRPDVLVVCHNSNCAEPADPDMDDTIVALRESLALQLDGRPVIDGIELDLFWRGADGVCLLAHDLNGGITDLAGDAAAVVADHLATAGELTAGGGPLNVFIELKAHVGADTSARHTPAQRVQHARCAWEVYARIADAAVANGRELQVFFASFGPELLREMIAQRPASVPFEPRYEAFYGIPRPLDSETRPLSDYAGLPISLVEFHAQWIHDAQYEGVISAGIDVGVFMFSATVETFAVIEQYQPTFVNTSEARLLRRWLLD